MVFHVRRVPVDGDTNVDKDRSMGFSNKWYQNQVKA